MEEKKIKCPYCGEEIMAAAKKCHYCGEWLHKNEEKKMVKCPVCNEKVEEGIEECPYCHEKMDGSTLKQHKTTTQANVAKIFSPIEQQHAQQPIIKVNKPMILTIMGVVALVSIINMFCEADWFHIIDSNLILGESLILILSSIIFTIVNINNANTTMTCLRWWIAVELFCLCAPITVICIENFIDNYFYEFIVVTALTTTVLSEIFFFSTKKLGCKTVTNLYTYGSIFYILLSIYCVISYFL